MKKEDEEAKLKQKEEREIKKHTEKEDKTRNGIKEATARSKETR